MALLSPQAIIICYFQFVAPALRVEAIEVFLDDEIIELVKYLGGRKYFTYRPEWIIS